MTSLPVHPRHQIQLWVTYSEIEPTKGRFTYFREERNQISWAPGFAQSLIGSKLADMPAMSKQAGDDVCQHSEGPKVRRSAASGGRHQKGSAKCNAANNDEVNYVLVPNETK